MPLYEYECRQCKKHTEKIQKFSDPEITRCPHCGGALKRVVSAAAISFKGGGWFKDGYSHAKPQSSKKESKSESGTKSDSGSSSVSSVDASASSSKDATPAAAPSEPASPAASPSSSSSGTK
jgi:putative FmdB family regulatory protein